MPPYDLLGEQLINEVMCYIRAGPGLPPPFGPARGLIVMSYNIYFKASNLENLNIYFTASNLENLIFGVHFIVTPNRLKLHN